MTVAFVLAGGASLGSVEVGMLQALLEAGITPDLLVGTSVGALNAAFIAGHPGLDGIAALGDVWRSITRERIFPVQAVQAVRGLAGRSNFLISNSGVRELIEAQLTFKNIEDALIPLQVVATEVTTGLGRVFTQGPAVEAVLASAAVPGIFPPVVIDGIAYMDGGITDNAPLSHAVTDMVDTIYVLPVGHACAMELAPRSAIGMVLQSVTLMIGRQLAVDIDRLREHADIRILPALCPLDISPIDFSHADELITRAYDTARAWIDDGQPEAVHPYADRQGHDHST